jgi:hypothetical protein
MADLPRLLKCDFFPFELNRTGRRRIGSCNDVEERGFTRPVGPNQPKDLTFFKSERDVVERPQTAEIFGNPIYLDNGHGTRVNLNPVNMINIF